MMTVKTADGVRVYAGDRVFSDVLFAMRWGKQLLRLMQIGAKCPVHRVLEGEVMFEESVELV